MRYTLLTVCLLAGCMNEAASLGYTEQDLDGTNGTSLNGTSLNGTSLNGTSLNGTSLNGTSLNGTSLNGTTITAVSTSGPPVSGTAVVGSTWTGTATNGASVRLRIDSAAAGTGTSTDLWFYGVSYKNTTGWSPLCGVDPSGVPIKALAVAGTWGKTALDAASYGGTATSFTWACRGKTVAKCVEAGYRTWRGYSVQLQACVRMLRADYCGTGVSHTVDGTLVNFFDNVGIQFDTEAWNPEAEWTPTGARCVHRANGGRYEAIQAKDACLVRPLRTYTCGTTFANGAVLIDELP